MINNDRIDHSHKKRNSLATRAVYFDLAIVLPYEVEHTRTARASVHHNSLRYGREGRFPI